MKKFTLYVIALVLSLQIQTTAFAHDLGHKKYNLGLSGAFGTGTGIMSGTFIFGDTDYQIAEFNAHFSFQMSPRTELQLRGGVAYYFVEDSNALLSRNDDHLGWNAELNGLFYFRKNPTLFDPYLVIGSGFPKIIHFGAGNRFALSHNTSAFVEALASTFILDYRAELRAGLSFHF